MKDWLASKDSDGNLMKKDSPPGFQFDQLHHILVLLQTPINSTPSTSPDPCIVSGALALRIGPSGLSFSFSQAYATTALMRSTRNSSVTGSGQRRVGGILAFGWSEPDTKQHNDSRPALVCHG